MGVSKFCLVFLILGYYVVVSLRLLVLVGGVDSADDDPTHGFTEMPLNASNFELHKPYDLPPCARYLYDPADGVHRFWVLKVDKPAWENPGNGSHPRSEIRMRGYEYTEGVWQFEGHGLVPKETTGVCIMQVFGADTHPTTMMLKFYDCTLFFYDIPLTMPMTMCDTWFRLNVIHDADAAFLKIYIDGKLVLERGDRTYATHWFQFGPYAQLNYSYYMESRWKGVRLLKLTS